MQSSTGQRLQSSERVLWGVAGGGALLAALLQLTVVRELPTPPYHVPLLGLAVMFGVGECLVVDVGNRLRTQTVSMVEVPLVLGLLAIRPDLVVPAHILGLGVAALLYRRQWRATLTFKLVTVALGDVAALLVFHSFADLRDLVSGTTIVAVLAATVTASAIGIAMGFTTNPIAGRPQKPIQMGRAAALGLAGSAATASTMVVGLALYQLDRPTIWLLAFPLAATYFGRRLFVSQDLQVRQLDLLHRSASAARVPGGRGSLSGLLHDLCETFQADVAALAYLPPGAPGSLAMAVIGPAGEQRPLMIVPRDGFRTVWERMPSSRSGHILRDRAGASLVSTLFDCDLRDGMVVAIDRQAHTMGYLAVANRRPGFGRFSASELKVLETLRHCVADGLEDDPLENSAQESRMLERQLVHRATHDSVTGLPNLAFLTDRVANRLSAKGCGRDDVAVLRIGLDDPVAVTMGHSDVLDEDRLLVIVAQRLRGCLRDTDVTARVGRHELAVLSDATGSPEQTMRLAQRVLSVLQPDIGLEGITVKVSASIGIAWNCPEEDTTTLMAASKDALRTTLASGGGRIEAR